MLEDYKLRDLRLSHTGLFVEPTLESVLRFFFPPEDLTKGLATLGGRGGKEYVGKRARGS